LSTIAQRYETYRFRRIEFGYDARCATSQVGTVGLVFDFDALDPAPVSQMDALSYHDKAADVPWKEQCVRLDLAQGDRLPSRYTRVGVPAGSYDIKTYDVGRLHVFTDGVGAVSNLGLLRVDYEVDLFTPQIQDPMGGSFYSTAGLTAAKLFGTNAVVTAGSNLPGSIVDGSFVFDQTFEGLVYLGVSGVDLAAPALVVITGPSGSVAQLLDDDIGSADTEGTMQIRVRATPGTTLTPQLTSATSVAGTIAMFSCAGYDSLIPDPFGV